MAGNVLRSYAESVEKIATRTGVKESDVKKVLRATQDEIMESMKAEKVFRFGNFGTFRVTVLGARKMRNPKTGATIDAPQRKRVRFTGGQTLTDLVEGKLTLDQAQSNIEAPVVKEPKAPKVKAPKVEDSATNDPLEVKEVAAKTSVDGPGLDAGIDLSTL